MSGSLAVTARLNVAPSTFVRLAIGAIDGARFTSLIVTAKLVWLLSAGKPLSIARTVIEIVFGPCASVGVQVKRPVIGLMLAPLGGDTSAYVKAFAGMSASLAVTVK